jgi:protein TonB
MLISEKKINTFAIKKDKYISISMNIPKNISNSVKKSIKEREKKVIDKAKAPTKKKEVDIDNLFNDVWTKSIKKTKKIEKKPEIRRLQEIQKKINQSNKNSVESVIKKVKNIKASKVSEKTAKTSTADEVNEYLAKIQALVYEHFYPPQNSEGNSVKAIIELSSIGRVHDFRILNYSSHDELNRECDKLKDRLISVLFPKNPDKKSGRYEIKLTSQE